MMISQWIYIPNLNPLSLFKPVSNCGFTDNAHNPTGGEVISSGTSAGEGVICRIGDSKLISASSLRGGFFCLTITELLQLKLMLIHFYLII